MEKQSVSCGQRKALLQNALEQHEGALLRYAARITRRADLAGEVVQETFLKLIVVESPPAEPTMRSWLFTVCRNKAIDVLRKEKRMNSLSEEGLALTPDSGLNPAERVEMGDTHANILTALTKLPPNQQEVLRLKYQNEFSYKQIAEITGLSVSNVGFLLHTGMQNLRGMFRESGMIQA